MVKVTCSEIGNCPLADGQIHEVDSIPGHRCAMRDEVGRCGLEERIGGPPPEWPRLALIGVAGVVVAALLGVGVWAGVGAMSPKCDQTKITALLSLDPKAGELEKAGGGCLKRGLKRADIDALVRGVQVLRLGADKGSAQSALALGRLYDPIVRPEVEKGVKSPDILPPADAAIAARYYDLAAKGGSAAAGDAAKALRAKFSLPSDTGAQAGNPNGLPLAIPGHPDFYQRVLAKPGATLVSAPGAAGGQPVKVFEILYVFERRPGWLRVGHDLQTGPEGWVAQTASEDWQVMLTASYAPPGQRKPVLFFKDDLGVAALLSKPGARDEVASLLQGVSAGQVDPRLVAVEDKAVDWSAKPYVMPILKTRQVVTDDGRTVTLARVASVSGLGSSGPSASAPAPGGASGSCPAASLASVRHAIVFVIDTTSSMAPYIAEAKRVATGWERELKRRGLSDSVRFGLIGFRNNMDEEPQRSRLEYVSKEVVRLSPASDAGAFLSAVDGMTVATVSTHTFDEDGVAGLRAAVDQDWSPFCGARLIIYISDAGVLRSDDPKSRFVGQGLASIAAEAREKRITVLPVHLQTPEARAAGDIERAREQYQGEISRTSANRLPAYSAIAGGSPAAFNDYLTKVGVFVGGMEAVSKGVAKAPNIDTSGPVSVDALILNELFSVQQRFLGAAAGATAPNFADSWTSDRDLSDPNLPALEIGVFLTRRQLNQLAEQTERLVRTARRAELETDRFFNLLRMVSAATTQDPRRFGDDTARVGDMLPSFLALLPYKSDVLSLSEESWRGMGATKQDAFIRRLEQKLQFYRKLESDQSKWRNLASGTSGDAGGQVAIVPLQELP